MQAENRKTCNVQKGEQLYQYILDHELLIVKACSLYM